VKSFSAVKQSDVRINIMKGICFLLQSFGQKFKVGESGGWKKLLEVLTLPTSTTVETAEEVAWTLYPWPLECLSMAFEAIKLISDEFLDIIKTDEDISNALMTSLSSFSSQAQDINVALTALELLWKVSDEVLLERPTHAENSSVGRDVLLQKLMNLVKDSRPDIRQCALNTLFTGLISNIERSTNNDSSNVFDQYISPLFAFLESKVTDCMRYEVFNLLIRFLSEINFFT
jgi:hypothetical protein